MKSLRDALHCLAFSFLCSLLLGGTVFVWRAPRIINQQADNTRSALIAETHIAIADADQRITDALTKIDNQTKGALAEVHAISFNVNERAGEALDILRDTETDLNGQVDGLRSDLSADLKPSLDNTAALVKDAQDSLDDSYFDIKASIESATVTTHSIALASEAIAGAAPSVSASAVGIGKSADGIAADAHKATSEFVKPKTFWQQLQSLLLTFARIYGAI